MSPALYLVTDGARFIDAHLVEALAKAKHVLTVIDTLLPSPRLASKAPRYQRSIISGLDDTFMRDAFDGVFHLAALPHVQYSIEHPEETNKVNYSNFSERFRFAVRLIILRELRYNLS